MSTSDVQKRLAEIAREIKAGAAPEKFKAETDRLLGTAMEDRDELVEAHWEESYRNGEKDGR